ncbi:MAG: hypothetical protein ABEJ31_06735 [Haloarculaceae archaeon]
MRLFVGIDDTDSIDSDHGTGRVSRDLGARLADAFDLRWAGSVRQQFLVDPRVPYTTHNSAACMRFDAESPPFDEVVEVAAAHLREVQADVADPGLCVAAQSAVPSPVTAFGRRAQESVVSKEQAYEVAADADLFLEEYGGTGDGVIGALGAVGLTADGDDGRFVAYGAIREYGARVSVEELRDDGIAVVDASGEAVATGTVATHDWIRPQLRGGEPTLPVEPDGDELKPANLS